MVTYVFVRFKVNSTFIRIAFSLHLRVFLLESERALCNTLNAATDGRCYVSVRGLVKLWLIDRRCLILKGNPHFLGDPPLINPLEDKLTRKEWLS